MSLLRPVSLVRIWKTQDNKEVKSDEIRLQPALALVIRFQSPLVPIAAALDGQTNPLKIFAVAKLPFGADNGQSVTWNRHWLANLSIADDSSARTQLLGVRRQFLRDFGFPVKTVLLERASPLF
ncbi:MAG TPA: hypothetical protein VEV41_18910 [Terriglobales bacterium]|nr:hypothetical protein [Terriglobales bacterium]